MEPLLIWAGLILALPLLTHESKTTVILLDNESFHNAVVVATNAGSVIVDQPYSYTTLVAQDKKPSSVEKANPEAIREKYAQQLNMLPTNRSQCCFILNKEQLI